MSFEGKTVNILGTTYTLREQSSDDNPKMKDSSGLCETYSKELIIDPIKDEPDNYSNIDAYKRRVVRHELVHAFFDESGLRGECKYAVNEELVDWIAIQLPKLTKACQELGVLDE